jgi:hypothetical protein
MEQELPSVAAQWADDLRLSFPILSDPNLEVSAQYVGTFDIGEYLLRAGVTPDLGGCITCRPAIVLVDKARVVRTVHMATKENDEVDIGQPPPPAICTCFRHRFVCSASRFSRCCVCG